ncbi:Endonuclease/exonuclease/phosphatase [Microdochium trichocladiopsis]|uniref:Endonuclease/exonuclease/phosphatase n=1 Tax=Microdochium trichocladiopsis TaxID=1682393 RepID=A0A9P8YEI3_9PEZI|nr:Endonuclease/exonuclease/phosphatase [Microdochium trichocladiopsis]KAH7037536.1 Endonuclease/exonuclease/phosphatase [Microdochium trichocladiopsis]
MALEPLSTADVFVLTFNAQKQLINVPVFATHLLDAFTHHAAALPDLVVFSLQEMAPLAKAFVGTQLLGPYFDAYETALNRAAAKYMGQNTKNTTSDSAEGSPFSLIATRNVGMTASIVFARDAATVSSVRAAEVGFGAGDMANKGAVGLRLLYTSPRGGGGDGDGRTEITFVTTHLAAMEWNLAKRNKNWASLVSGLVFEDPQKYVDRAAARSRDSGAASRVRGAEGGFGLADESRGLLEGDRSELDRDLHNLSIYKPGSHLFVAGDLNYRISTTSPESEDVFPSVDPNSPDYYPKFLDRDQLTQERKAGRTLHGMSEADIKFPPTYKLVCLPKDDESTDSSAEQAGSSSSKDFQVDDVKWKWALHRWPGWCDRILYRDTPQTKMRVIAYDALPPIRTSDHRPVYLRIQVPLIAPETLGAIPDAIEDDSGVLDTRVALPFPVDLDSWRHRASVKKWESAMGWSLLAAQSKQIIASVLATLLLVGVGAWWYTAMSSVV